MITDVSGKPVRLVGTAQGKSKIALNGPDQKRQEIEIAANAAVPGTKL